MKEKINIIHIGDCLKGLKKIEDNSISCCVTSPPYWRLRDYGMSGQLGLEPTPELYVDALTNIFEEVRRVLKPDGTLWLNLGDVYWRSVKGGKNPNGHMDFGKVRKRETLGIPITGSHPEIKPKDLVGLPWMVAFALRKSGWWLRQDIIWHKPAPMPESVTDRCTRAHEYLFLLSKSKQYYFDHVAIKTPAKGKNERDRTARISKKRFPRDSINGIRKAGGPYLTANRRSVWSIQTKPFRGEHYATFPQELPELCIKAGSKEEDTILDPFMGAGTTALAARSLNRNYIGFELNPVYVKMARERLAQ